MPITGVTPDMAVTYGAYTVGGSSGRPIDGKIKFEDSFDRGVIEFDFLVTGSTEATFASACQAAEAAFRLIRQTVNVKVGSTNLIDWSHSAATGFDSTASCVKKGDAADTGRSRIYTARIVCERPADQTGLVGRRTSSVTVDYPPSKRKKVSIAGTWTAISTTKARAQYNAQIAAYCASVLTALTGNYELTDESAESNTDDTLLVFRRTYEELIYTQAGSVDDSAIVKQSFRTTKSAKDDNGDSDINASDISTINASYECAIDKTVTTDLSTKWSAIRSWIISRVRTAYSLAYLALVNESVTYDWDNNGIAVSLTFEGRPRGAESQGQNSNILENELTYDDEVNPGWVLVPSWNLSGNPYVKFRYQGPGRYLRTITEKFTLLNQSAKDVLSGPPAESLARARGFEGNSFGKSSVVLSRKEGQTPKFSGLTGNTIKKLEFTRVTVIEIFGDGGLGTMAGGGGVVGRK